LSFFHTRGKESSASAGIVHEDDAMPFNVRCLALEKKYDALEERIRAHNEKNREFA